MAQCVKCGDDNYSGITINGQDYCYPCAEARAQKNEKSLVDSYPHGRVHVHNLLNLWAPRPPKDQPKG